MEKKHKSIIILIILCLMFISVGVFLGFNYMNINKEGLKCLSDPIVWAEDRISTEKGENYVCSCKKEENLPIWNINFGGKNGS